MFHELLCFQSSDFSCSHRRLKEISNVELNMYHRRWWWQLRQKCVPMWECETRLLRMENRLKLFLPTRISFSLVFPPVLHRTFVCFVSFHVLRFFFLFIFINEDLCDITSSSTLNFPIFLYYFVMKRQKFEHKKQQIIIIKKNYLVLLWI